MIAGMGKRKGSSYERLICKILSLWYSEGKYDKLCWRSAGSGSVGTVSRTDNPAFAGDITAMSPLIDPLLRVVCIECKHYRHIDITGNLRGLKADKFAAFWQQASMAAGLSGRFPVVVMKSNFLPILLVIGKELAQTFAGVLKKDVPFLSINNELFIANFEDTLAAIDLGMFKIIVNMYDAQREQSRPLPFKDTKLYEAAATLAFVREPKRIDA